MPRLMARKEKKRGRTSIENKSSNDILSPKTKEQEIIRNTEC